MTSDLLHRCCLLLALAATPAVAAVSVTDDSGKQVTLARPAQRVISMSPHVTELLFAAGGGARVVGAMNYSDYPEAAKAIPLVGSNASLDMEKLLALKPDLLVVWQSGNTARQLEQLRQLGIPMFYSEPQQMDQIASGVERLGQLMGTEAVAARAAAAFRAKTAALAARYARRPTVRMFYQIWDKPLYTLNGKQIVSDAVKLCGGENVFAALPVKAPEVTVEAVLGADPEVIVGSELDGWKPYKSMLAVRRGNLFSLADGLLARAGPRMVDATAELCEKLELARQRRP
jgi:iron complex transport system substrate-binding protein